MADITRLLQLATGMDRGVDLTTNTPVVLSIKIGGGTNTELTKAILDNLVNLQNGTDFSNGTNSHTHDGRYFTKTQLQAATNGTDGSRDIGDFNNYTNFTPSAATVKGALQGINTALGTITSDFLDSVFRISDDGDPTKKIAFQASGISTATTRTITMPDSNVNLGLIATAIQRDGSVAFTANQPMGGFKLTGLGAGSGAGDSVRYEQAILASGANAWTANQSLGGNKITNSADPTSAQDLATKAYVDAQSEGLKPKQAVRAGSIANLNLASMPASVDGVTLTSGDRFLAKNQTAPAENGIYIFNGAGSAATRSPDMDSLVPIDEVNGAYTFIQSGTQAGQGWVEQSVVAVLGTDPMVWVYFNSAAAIIGGDMITVVGQTISVDLAAVSGLESSNPGNNAGQLRVKLEASNPSLQINGSNELGVKLNGAGAITSGASGLIVGVDNSTIEINTNALRVKDAGITLAKLASNSVDENKIVSTTFSATGAITGGSGTKVAWNPDGSSLEISANAARIKTTAYDQSTITGGGGSAAAVQYAPSMKRTLVAGEAFSADTSFLVRWARTGETAGRVYKADSDANTNDLFYVIGVGYSLAGVSAGGNLTVTSMGSYTLGGSDTPFSSGDVGKPVFLGSAGAFSTTAPTTAGFAVTRAGIVQTTTSIDVHSVPVGVN